MKRILLAGAVISLSFASTAGAQWQPPKYLPWYWQLQGTVKVEAVQATDIDGFDNGASVVQKLHTAGQHAICYIDVGTAENWRPDYSQFPRSDLGKQNGWPGEKWLNITDSAVRPILDARFKMCRTKGFDAVEPDNMDGWENSTGFKISAAQQLAFNEWVAADVHSHRMAAFQKNDPEQATQLQPYFNGMIDEQCNQYGECDSVKPYLTAGKPVLNAEYQTRGSYCTADNRAGIMGAIFDLNLDGRVFKPCW
jgi:hypothetical protein